LFVSGDVIIVSPLGSVAHRGIARLGELGPRLPSFALIGGLSVIIRLGQTHRATNDVDTVTDDQVNLLEALVTAGFERQGESILLESDLKLDVVDVSEGDPAYVPYLTHRFAFDTRTPVLVVVMSSDREVLAQATVQVARSSALVAVKLGISEGVGRKRDPRKVGSDAFDTIRLLERTGPDVLADEVLALAPFALVRVVADLARLHLVENVDRTASSIIRSSVQGVEPVSAERIELLGRAFVARLATQPDH
jgi:hypothetical protein